jgi:hypothetical protein
MTTMMITINSEEEVEDVGRDLLSKELYQRGGEERRGEMEREEEVVEYEWFGGKKMEKEGGWTNKYKDCHPESQGDGGQPISAPLLRK